VDAAEPPRIEFESSAKCADVDRAEDVLRQVLARARAPGRAWVVRTRMSGTTTGELRAAGEIVDDDGAEIGHRAFAAKSTDCSGLARAIGVWASLVLDGEIRRPHSVANEEPPPAKIDGAQGAPPDSAISSDARRRPVVAGAVPPPVDAGLPASGTEGKLSRREDNTLELGMGAFLMTGTGGLLAGVTPFFVIEVGKGVFLRPALVLGERESLPSSQTDMMLAATRLDGCLRVAGLYTKDHGIQLDMCGGVDAGVLNISGQALHPYVAVGPSVDLRGELGGFLSVVLRGLGGVNAVQTGPLDVFVGRGELALSWRLR
jgi:hypothetical protein